jgi:HEAT repeat protein
MRFALFALAGSLVVCAAAAGQDTKKNDAPTEVKEVAGKTLEQWIKEIHGPDPSKREHAMRMVLGFGQAKSQRAVPAILDELKKHKPLEPIDLSVRIAGTIALGTILTYVEADPKQSADIKVPDAKEVKEAAAILKTFCNDEQVIVRTRAVQALARLGPILLTAQKEIIHVAEDKATWEARQAGLETLAIVGLVKEKVLEKEKALPKEILGIFYKRIDEKIEKSMQVRITAAKALAQFTIPPSNAEHAFLLKKLKMVTEDPEPSVRIWGHLAMMTVKLKTELKKELDPEHLAAIAKMVAHNDPVIRIQAAQSLALCGPKAARVSDSLIAALDDPDTNVVASCIVALVHLEAKNAVPALEEVAKDSKRDESVKQAAVDACDAIRNPNKKLEKKDKTETKQ